MLPRKQRLIFSPLLRSIHTCGTWKTAPRLQRAQPKTPEHIRTHTHSPGPDRPKSAPRRQANHGNLTKPPKQGRRHSAPFIQWWGRRDEHEKAGRRVSNPPRPSGPHLPGDVPEASLPRLPQQQFAANTYHPVHGRAFEHNFCGGGKSAGVDDRCGIFDFAAALKSWAGQLVAGSMPSRGKKCA